MLKKKGQDLVVVVVVVNRKKDEFEPHFHGYFVALNNLSEDTSIDVKHLVFF
jgi:hypothetical protein